MTAQTPEQLAAVRAALLDAIPVGVVLLDASGKVVEANPAAQRVLGLSDGPVALNELAERVADPLTGRPIRERDLPWRRALAGEAVHTRDLSVVLPRPRAAQHVIAICARPFQHPAWSAAGAVLVAFDRVQLLFSGAERVALPPYLRRVLDRVCQGRTTEEISAELHLTVATTRLYLKRLRQRLSVNNRAQLVLRAIELGLYPRHWW